MRPGSVAALPLAALLLSSFAAAAAPAAKAGKVLVRYERPEAGKYKELEAMFKEVKLLENFATGIRETIVLPSDLTLITAQCGEENAFYDPNEQTITLCYELIEAFAALHAADAEEGSEEEIGSAVLGATSFVFFHELGHALAHLLDLPITGKEEDAVDQLATVVLVQSEDETSLEAALDGAFTFLLQGQQGEEEGEEPAFWDEHSLDQQRFYNIACWVNGSDPESFAAMVEDGWLPEERAVRCPSEWEQTSKAWNRLLEPHLKD